MDITSNLLSINQFDYPLPEERIAKYPLPCRDQSKLLIYNGKEVSETIFNQLPELLNAGDMLVFNNTKVVRARLVFEKATGARIEVFCLEPVDPADYEEAFQQRGTSVWKCLVGNRKKWKQGALTSTWDTHTLHAELAEDFDSYQYIRFTWDETVTWGEMMDSLGFTPIPPYLNRKSEAIDDLRYQTVYSKYKGSVAAPTAGLHFTPEVLQALQEKGVKRAEVTLHVGAGTFKPVTEVLVIRHEMHSEFFAVDRDTICQLKAQKASGRIIAVGTTSVRTIESLYWTGVKMLLNPPDEHALLHLTLKQFEAYELPQDVPFDQAMQAILDAMDRCGTHIAPSHTGIMIMPGYRFKAVDALITNFHQPKSTLLLLVSALIGDAWRTVYDYALAHDFRFLSYGDSSFLSAR